MLPMIWPIPSGLMLPVRRVKLPQLRLSIWQAAWLRRLAPLGFGHRSRCTTNGRLARAAQRFLEARAQNNNAKKARTGNRVDFVTRPSVPGRGDLRSDLVGKTVLDHHVGHATLRSRRLQPWRETRMKCRFVLAWGIAMFLGCPVTEGPVKKVGPGSGNVTAKALLPSDAKSAKSDSPSKTPGPQLVEFGIFWPPQDAANADEQESAAAGPGACASAGVAWS